MLVACRLSAARRIWSAETRRSAEMLYWKLLSSVPCAGTLIVTFRVTCAGGSEGRAPCGARRGHCLTRGIRRGAQAFDEVLCLASHAAVRHSMRQHRLPRIPCGIR